MHANVLHMIGARGARGGGVQRNRFPSREAAGASQRARLGRRVVPLLLSLVTAACRHAPQVPSSIPPFASSPSGRGESGCAAAEPVASRAGDPVQEGAAVFDTAWSIIARTHWDSTYHGVDWGAVRTALRPRAAAARTRGELRAVLGEMVGTLRQSHFAVIPAELADAGGVGGAESRAGPDRGSGVPGLDVRLVDGAIRVVAVDTAGGAWRAGIRPGWTLEAVRGCALAPRLEALAAGADARRRALEAYRVTMPLLAGATDDTVALTLRDARDRRRSLAVVLRPAPGTVTKFGNFPPMAAQLGWQRVRRDGRVIGIIRFNVWMPVLAADFDAAIDSLRASDALVLDLRGNLGGIGGMTSGIAGHFLDTTVALGTMHQRGGTTRFLVNPRRVDTRQQRVRPFAGPLAIVIDELSASTTEIFAGGLQQLGRATVFGSQSAGQALPAVPERLPNGDVLYHAVADFTSPNGKPVEGVGVIPDRVTPVTRRSLVAGRDTALSAALAWAASTPVRSRPPS